MTDKTKAMVRQLSDAATLAAVNIAQVWTDEEITTAERVFLSCAQKATILAADLLREVVGAFGKYEGAPVQGGLSTALDLIEARMVPAVVWDKDQAVAGKLHLSIVAYGGVYQWTIARGNGMDDDIDVGDSPTMDNAREDCEDALLRLVGCK